MPTEPARRPRPQLRVAGPPPNSAGPGAVEVRPLVDGRDLLRDAYPHGVGASPRHLLDPDTAPLHATAMPHEVRLSGGGCGAEVWGGSWDAERLGYPWPPTSPA